MIANANLIPSTTQERRRDPGAATPRTSWTASTQRGRENAPDPRERGKRTGCFRRTSNAASPKGSGLFRAASKPAKHVGTRSCTRRCFLLSPVAFSERCANPCAAARKHAHLQEVMNSPQLVKLVATPASPEPKSRSEPRSNQRRVSTEVNIEDEVRR
jgi:hypothetical protein